MNKSIIFELLTELPTSLRERISGYVDSVINSMDAIFESAGKKYSEEIATMVIVIAASRKLFDIINAAYWTLDNTAIILEDQGTSSIRIGGTSYSRSSQYYSDLFLMQDNIKKLLIDINIYDYVYNQSYSDIVKSISNEH